MYMYIAGQTSGPKGLTFFEGTHGYAGGKKLFLSVSKVSRTTPGTSTSI